MARCKNTPETTGRTNPPVQIKFFKDDEAKARYQTLKGRQTLPEKGFFLGDKPRRFPSKCHGNHSNAQVGKICHAPLYSRPPEETDQRHAYPGVLCAFNKPHSVVGLCEGKTDPIHSGKNQQVLWSPKYCRQPLKICEWVERESNDFLLQDMYIPGADWDSANTAVERDRLKPDGKLWMHFIKQSLMPTSHTATASLSRLQLLHSILNGQSIDVGKIIMDEEYVCLTRKSSPLLFPHLITTLCKKKGVFESPEDLQRKERLGITSDSIPSLVRFDEAATSKQPTGGAKTIVAAKLAALTTMAEITRDQLEELKTDLRTYFKYVQERDQVIKANFNEMLPQSSLNFPSFPQDLLKPAEAKMPEPQPAQPPTEHTSNQPQEKPLGSDSASSSPTPPDATPQHNSPPTQVRKGKEPINIPTTPVVEIDSEETATFEDEEEPPTYPYTTSCPHSCSKKGHQKNNRFVASHAWLSRFPEFRVTTTFTATFEHCIPLLDALTVAGTDMRHARARGDYFRFEECWSKESACIDRVCSAWMGTTGSTISKLQAIRGALKNWQADRRTSSRRRLLELQSYIDSCIQGPIAERDKAALLDAKREHKSLLDKEESYWAQHSRVAWLTHRDRNTAYFHAQASGRRKKNRICGLYDDEIGSWTDKHAEVAGLVTHYFTTLFASSHPTPHPSLLSNIIPCIDSTMNESLMRPFTNDEILSAFQDINPRKASGIDGLLASFYHQHWDLIGKDVIQLCQDLLSQRIDMATVNNTIIALIPKVTEPVCMKQLRPISLWTTIYKIVSKTLLNRMKPYLHLFISENQSAFLKGRLISDNILIAYELIHYLSSSKIGSNKGVALKLDMEKAFDRVEWTFLCSVMLRVGFHPDWVALIMECVTTITFSTRVNDKLTTEFTPQRGLRQGDPLSSFLFLLCMQGLSAALQAEQKAGNIMGIQASQQGPRINHLFYADESIIFVCNSVQEFTRLKEVLHIFAYSSGQRINFDKSTVFFSPNTMAAHRQRLLSTLPLYEVLDPGIYLGAPLKVGKNKTNVFNYINETVDKRIDRWTKRLLSFGGREIFLKSVAQALPQYIMSCYLLPRIITDRITSSMRRYWWTGKANDRGWALMARDKICTPKNAGGLGLRDLRCFNLALLGKQLWRLLTRPESLVARVFRAKYILTGSLLDARIKDHSSFAWKGLHTAL
ncbi:hypothetical protein GQ457_04G021670 [Hibiscus cannabinus]